MASQLKSRSVTLFCQHFYPEMISTGMHMTELATALTRLGWSITVYCAKPSLDPNSEQTQEVEQESTYEGVRIRRVPSVGAHRGSMIARGLMGVSFMLGCAWAALRHRREYDAILMTTNPPFLGLIGWAATKLLHKPYVLIVYDIYPDIAINLGAIGPRSLIARIWRRVTRLIMRSAARNVVIGRDMAEIVRAKLGKGREDSMVLIPNWSDERVVNPVERENNPFRAEHGIGDRMLVQYSGMMGRTHNLECLIEAAELLKDKDIVFQFIGGGAKKEKLMQMAEERGLENVRFLPYQPLPKLADVLSAADLSVVCLGKAFTGLSVPSKTYGVMAGGTPILGLLESQSEIGLTIVENDCGVVLEEPTGKQVADVIGELLDNPDRLRMMGQNGHRAFLENYTLSHAARRYSDVLESIL